MIQPSTYFPNSLTTLLQMEAKLEDHVLDGEDHASSSGGAVADWYLNLRNMQFEIFDELVNSCISFSCMQQKKCWFQQHWVILHLNDFTYIISMRINLWEG